MFTCSNSDMKDSYHVLGKTQWNLIGLILRVTLHDPVIFYTLEDCSYSVMSFVSIKYDMD